LARAASRSRAPQIWLWVNMAKGQVSGESRE
jgi:hypothetical protein